MTAFRRTRLTVDLAALGRNVGRIRSRLAPGVRLMAVVKADAYGHGLVPAARAAVRAGADWLGVAIPEEGVQLRKAGLSQPVLVLGGANREGARAAAAHGLRLAVFSEEGAVHAGEAARELGTSLPVHLKLDTGMARLGARGEAQAEALLAAVRAFPGLAPEGVFTHFADADNPDPAYTDLQLNRFRSLLARLPRGLMVHAAASAATLSRPDSHFDMVRPGIALYGCPPVPDALGLEPCLRFTAEVACVKTVEAGEAVGYGRTRVLGADTRVAVLWAGYGDGYPRALSNRASVLIGGRRCPVLGRVCMDLMMADVSAVPGVSPGDEAVLMGRQGQELITAEELAAWAGTIPYEILLAPKGRVPVTRLP